jgi:hypothetical protein
MPNYLAKEIKNQYSVTNSRLNNGRSNILNEDGQKIPSKTPWITSILHGKLKIGLLAMMQQHILIKMVLML